MLPAGEHVAVLVLAAGSAFDGVGVLFVGGGHVRVRVTLLLGQLQQLPVLHADGVGDQQKMRELAEGAQAHQDGDERGESSQRRARRRATTAGLRYSSQ